MQKILHHYGINALTVGKDVEFAVGLSVGLVASFVEGFKVAFCDSELG